MTQQTDKIRIAIAGATGKMGLEAFQALRADARFQVSGVLVRHVGQAHKLDVRDDLIYDDPVQLLTEVKPDVWLDLTDTESVVRHIDLVVDAGVRPVIGATGYTQDDIARWDRVCKANELGGVAAPNFAVGALLMMRFAQEASRFFPQAEIIELHHDGKKDAPSGTAKRTAEAMASTHAIPIHSVRLPGLVAHQEVLFGGTGEVLTIRHDSLSRSSFMPGVLTSCAQVMKLQGMVYGLEHLLW